MKVQLLWGVDGRVVVACKGDLDLATRPKLDEAIQRALQPPETVLLVVDLSDVTFADSSAIDCTSQTQRRCHAEGIGFEVIPSKVVERLFALLQLDIPYESRQREDTNHMTNDNHQGQGVRPEADGPDKPQPPADNPPKSPEKTPDVHGAPETPV